MPYTDFGARHYSPTIRRWLTPDPLSEKYYTSSPYAYCADNPINLVDPDGRRIVGGTEEWNEQKTIIETRRNEVQNRVYKLIDKGKTSGERYSFLMRRLESLNKTLNTIHILESSSQVYNLNNKGGNIGKLSFASGEINIDYTGTTSNFVHEVTHAGQFENGDLAFRPSTGFTLLQDAFDEIEAYEAQSAFEGVRNMYDTPAALYGIIYQEESLYPANIFPDKRLRIDTPYALVLKTCGMESRINAPFYIVVKDIYYKQ